MTALSAGVYLIGCEDGSVYPMIVTLASKNKKIGPEKSRPGYAAAKLALGNPGFWWRRLVVPGVLPEDAGTNFPTINRIFEDPDV